MSQVDHQAAAYLSFSRMKRLGVFLPPPGWDASPWQGYPQHHGTNLYTWVDRCTMRVKCLAAQEHNTMSLAKAQTWTAYSRGRAN